MKLSIINKLGKELYDGDPCLSRIKKLSGDRFDLVFSNGKTSKFFDISKKDVEKMIELFDDSCNVEKFLAIAEASCFEDALECYDGSDFYPGMDLEDLANEFIKEGILEPRDLAYCLDEEQMAEDFDIDIDELREMIDNNEIDRDLLIEYIDYDLLTRDLSVDYEETNYGVIRLP